MRFGILQRYVAGEVLRSFIMALLTITIVFVLFIVMTEATRMGLSPKEILNLVPFVIPGSLPYTMPVSLLFAVAVVYGRLAGDNEVIAVKTAGLSAWIMLRPSIFVSLLLSGLLLVGSTSVIPSANTAAKRVIFKSFEDVFYKYLKKDHEVNRKEWPFVIMVKDVVDHTLIDAVIKHRREKPDPSRLRMPDDLDDPSQFDFVVTAKSAKIEFDIDRDMTHVYLDGSDIQQGGEQKTFVINDSQIDIPLPPDFKKPIAKSIQEMTEVELTAKQRFFRDLIDLERTRQAFDAALALASGRPKGPDWMLFQRAFIDYNYWEQQCNVFETERQMRIAMACGSFFFVFLGAPVAIRGARRDFLSAFIVCFVPIILIYYPLMLGGVNLGKDGMINPMYALWIGNVLLFVAALFTLRPVLRH